MHVHQLEHIVYCQKTTVLHIMPPLHRAATFLLPLSVLKMSRMLNGHTILFLCNWFCNPCASLEWSVKQFWGIFVAIRRQSVHPLSLQPASPVLPLCNPWRPVIQGWQSSNAWATTEHLLCFLCAISSDRCRSFSGHSAIIQLCFWVLGDSWAFKIDRWATWSARVYICLALMLFPSVSPQLQYHLWKTEDEQPSPLACSHLARSARSAGESDSHCHH